ncbi:Mitochondrial dicarboxylate transporter [Beauveria asiatica]|uniref:Mitochondrial dicarboxylate transporter n=1 Tax=Beauveria asiatica TaxID=1069075 RepID=A0AAW0S886_9HYPO
MSSAQESASKPSAQTTGQKKTASPAIRYPFWFGGSASSMAACVRLQTRHGNAPKNMSGTFVHILKNDGIVGLYSGISASLMRQLTYSTVRFGVYEELKMRYTRSGRTTTFPALTAMAVTAGFLGGIAGNFADVINVRMQHDAALPPDQRRNYKHALDGMARMARDEGLSSYFRGWLPNASRAAVMTAGQLATYDTFKGILIEYTPMGDNLTTHFSASFLAGLAAATATSPIDVIKTRVMSSSQKQDILQVIKDISRTEGMGWMFKGWVPSFLRLGPHTICTFVFLEAHRKLYRAAKGIDDNKD